LIKKAVADGTKGTVDILLDGVIQASSIASGGGEEIRI